MSTRVSYSDATSPFDVACDADASEDFFSGERICPPPERGGGNVIGAIYAALTVCIVAGWMLVGWHVPSLSPGKAPPPATDARLPSPLDPDSSRTAPVEATDTPPVVTDVHTAQQPSAPQSETALAEPSITGAARAEPEPQRDRETASDASDTAKQDPVADEDHSATAAASAPLPPPIADRTDALQTRALAAGLHPGLSRVLLARLTPADYRNAGIAIAKAIAATPDDGVYIWPRQRVPDRALFNVHFVAGAPADCRRYVVTVTKDGWTTTAPPMERCGRAAADRATKHAT